MMGAVLVWGQLLGALGTCQTTQLGRAPAPSEMVYKYHPSFNLRIAN